MNETDLKEIFEKELFRGEIKFDEPMSEHTSLKIGGPVDIMVFPEDPVSLKNVVCAANRENIPVFVFGSGTNLLVGDDGVRGIAVSLKLFRSIETTKESSENHVVLYVGAGVPLAMLVNLARKYGYSGIESLAGIPGCVGGAVYMNAGSYGTEMKDIIVSVAIMNSQGEIIILKEEDLGFSYRESHFPEGSIILSANIMLGKDDPSAVESRTREILSRKKASQPLGESSAGCVFKNPDNDTAGRLIDAAGCKGMRKGGLEVSRVHANYFINSGHATCRDFAHLMEAVKAKVKESSGIELMPEVKIIGNEK